MQTAKITAFVFGLALVSSACGDSMSALNPTAPSSLSPDSVNIEAGADGVAGTMGNGPKPGNGNGNGNGNGGNGNGNGNGNGQTPALTSGVVETRVQMQGTIDAKGNNSITVNRQVVNVTSQTVIRKGDVRYEFAALAKGDQVHVDALRSDNNGLVTVEAKEIKLQNPGEGGETEPPPPPPPPSPTGELSVEAVDAAAEEGPSNTGKFRITRSGSPELLAQPLTLSFSFGGNASHGSDYNASKSVEFAGGVATADVEVTALRDNVREGSEAVTLMLSAVGAYTVGASASATVNITDPAGALVTVEASEDAGLLIFALKRSEGNMAAALTVKISMGGTAVEEVDYTAMGVSLASLTFPAGEAVTSVLVVPMTPGKTIVMTVVDGDGYFASSPSSVTVTMK